jgi:chromosome segregation ATPase
MSSTAVSGEVTEVSIKNVGGIDEASLQIDSGVTALVGENATNRTSIIQAISAGLGVDQYSLKSDSDVGEVKLSVGDETYTRKLWRENGSVRTGGETYLDDPTVGDLYGVLLRSNRIRQAVREDRDLRDLILEPVNTEEIEEKISDRTNERREVDDELDRLETMAEKRTELETERQQVKDRLAELRTTLEAKRSELDAAEADTENEESDIQSELDEKLTALREARSELQRVSANLDSERKSLESLRESRETVEDQYKHVSEPDESKLSALEDRIETLRDRQQSVSSTITELQQVIRFNEDQLSDSETVLPQELRAEDDQSVTEQLDPSNATTTCWTCGSQVEQSRIEGMLDRLQSLRTEKVQEKNRIESDLDDLRTELDELKSRREERETLRSELSSLEEKLEQTESNIEEFEKRKADLTERVADLEEVVESLQASQQDELLSLQEEISKIEFERDEAESELERIESNIENIESELDRREALLDRRDTLSDEIEQLRTKVERIESDAVDQFNSHMASLVDRLGYDNIDRIWMEQTETEVKRGRQKTTETQFELHVIRENDAGEAYEDTLDHLSESEREIVGLVVALAGYIVHGVHEQMPFMLLDSVEMIDGERLVELVSYLQEYVSYLVVVLLPDHAQAFEDATFPQNYQSIDI